VLTEYTDNRLLSAVTCVSNPAKFEPLLIGVEQVGSGAACPVLLTTTTLVLLWFKEPRSLSVILIDGRLNDVLFVPIVVSGLNFSLTELLKYSFKTSVDKLKIFQ